MKTQKMSLANIQGKLSREEMKNIMAGSGGTCQTGPCSVYDANSGVTYTGTCGYVSMGGGLQLCECDTGGGFYNPQGGVSRCYS